MLASLPGERAPQTITTAIFNMGLCTHHPQREADIQCMKHQVHLCQDCLGCRDPKIYCKFRSACPIWFMQKTAAKWDDEDSAIDIPNRAAAGFE